MTMTDPEDILGEEPFDEGFIAERHRRRRAAPLHRAPNPAEVDDLLQTAMDYLEDESVAYEDVCDEAGKAEADYKYAFHMAVQQFKAVKPEQQRTATVHLETHKEFRAWKEAQARQLAFKEYLSSLRTRVEVLRTQAANYRSQGAPA
jgi:hypothetical protein